jgi:hypothetical protein
MGCEETDAVIGLAIDLAERQMSRLTLLVLAPAAPATIWLSQHIPPYTPQSLLRDAIEEAARTCRAAVAMVPDDIPLDFRVLPGAPHRSLLRLPPGSERGTLVLRRDLARRRGMRRTARRWRNSGMDVRLVGKDPAPLTPTVRAQGDPISVI